MAYGSVLFPFIFNVSHFPQSQLSDYYFLKKFRVFLFQKSMNGTDMKNFKFHHLSSCKMMWAMMVFIIFIIPYKSLWSSDEIYFYRNWTNWLLIAICNGNLWISWTCWIVYTIFTIFPALSKILCFNMLQTSSKVTSTWKK